MAQRTAVLIVVTLLHAGAVHRILRALTKPTRAHRFVLWGLLCPIISPLFGLMIALNLELPGMAPRNLERFVIRPLFFLNSLSWGWAAQKLLGR